MIIISAIKVMALFLNYQNYVSNQKSIVVYGNILILSCYPMNFTISLEYWFVLRALLYSNRAPRADKESIISSFSSARITCIEVPNSVPSIILDNTLEQMCLYLS